MAEPKITVLANIGDRYPMDYGGHIVFQAEAPDGRVTYHSEYWDEPILMRARPKPVSRDGLLQVHEAAEEVYEVYRWDIERDAVSDLEWADLQGVADTLGRSLSELEEAGRSDDPIRRAVLYEEVGRYHGFMELDAMPVKFSRAEMEERWPEFK